MRHLLVLGLVLGCGSAPSSTTSPGEPPAVTAPTTTAAADAEPMTTFTLSGYLLAGAEYWPYVGTAEIDYPKAVLWGFYPKAGVIAPGETDPNVADARPEAIACARRAYDALRAFLRADPPALRQIVERGASQGFVPRFYLWTNDYTRAATPYPPGVREARLWYWKRKQPEPDRPPGYWKWESTLAQDGECRIPSAPQIEAYLAETLKAVDAAAR